MNASQWLKESTGGEFSEATLGDPRRVRRLEQIADCVGKEPTASFPDLFGTGAELEGFYRFVRNEKVTWESVLEPHLAASCRRAEALGECLAIHDTTEFQFSGDREGLGRTSSKERGFFGHATLLVATDMERTPLGLGNLEQYARTDREGRRTVEERRDDKSSEGHRWLRCAQALEKRVGARLSCIHVADREGDSFPFLSGLVDFGARFIIRVGQQRRLEDEYGEVQRLDARLLELEPVTSFDIAITARGKRLNPTMARSHPSRRERVARVSLAATTVTIQRPKSRVKGSAIELNVVRVWEANPPKGEPAVEWILWTGEPVGSPAEMRRVVDYYRSRWVIEEYFKALKTGCRFETRQLESIKTLSTALAIFAPVAWKLLLMRSVARREVDAPAETVLTPVQIRFLEAKYGKPVKTARAALLTTAMLGGHLKQNGEPGWQTLAKGYEKLLSGEAFFLALQPPTTCDQS